MKKTLTKQFSGLAKLAADFHVRSHPTPKEHLSMKRIGMIGGIGPESTVDYYKRIIGAFHERQADLNNWGLIIADSH